MVRTDPLPAGMGSGTPKGIVAVSDRGTPVLRMAGYRTFSLVWLALTMAWVIGMGLWLYPDVKEEFEEKQYLARIAKERPPMITGDCTRMRGIESRDFIREDKNPDRCWVDLLTFRRLYPELAPHTDEQASARIRVENGLPLENWDESPWEELLKAAALTFGPPAGTLAALLLRRKRRKRVRCGRA
jgi:hypothetical protein